MGYREEILSQLYRILEKNTADARGYYWMADKCKRSSLKCFFKKLSLQKRIFCRRIKYEIRELEREIAIIEGNPHHQNKIIPPKPILESTSLRKDIDGLITYCYKREQQYLEIYKNLLSRTNLGNIREMLLSQKHLVQLALNEVKRLESRIPNGKGEEETIYS